MSEAQLNEEKTRKLLIDKLLEEAGWKPIVRYQPRAKYYTAAVEEYETENGRADYILFYKGQPLAVVEGKKVAIGPQEVLEQAQRYAKGFQDSNVNFEGFRVPFAYSTNGKIIWFRDLRKKGNRRRKVAKFHTPQALQEFMESNKELAAFWLQRTPVDHPRLRPYQCEAIQKIEEALASDRRKMLVAMATGTGKTFATIALLYRLLKSGFAHRILWLVDRRVLAAQAVNELSAFEAEPGLKFDKIYEVFSQRFKREDFDENMKFNPKILPNEYLADPKTRDVFIYVCTIQRMRINLFGLSGMFGSESGDKDDESDAEILNIPIHAFDIVVADECHRGYTSAEESKWREVLDHFDGIKIGLTATPAAHTKAYFTDIVFRYEYEKAVQEGYLVDYDAVRIESGVRMNGIFLKEGEEVGLKDTQTGQLVFDILEDERSFDTTQIEKKATSPDCNQKIVKEFAKYAQEQEEKLGRFPKTLIFADNDIEHISHSDQLVEMLRDEFGRGDAFVQKITGSPSVDRPLQKIREFRNRPVPGIVVTVDMLSTGVDIPKVENIIFIRPVKSRILFEQMLGRGTRKCDEINKTHFTVFDAVGVLEYFKKASAFTIDPLDKPTRSIREIIQKIYNNEDRDYNVKVLVRRLQRIAKNVSGEGRELFAAFISEGDISAFAKSLPERLENDWANTINLLLNKDFQYLLETYPRVKPIFVIATGYEDFVSSEYLFRTTDGRELKPEDYLKAFERFVKENPDHIEAIRILFNRPQDFRTEELKELRKKLAARPERFTEENLRKAYHHELADIISIVRHAMTGENIFSAEERVNQAMAHIRQNKTFTLEQEKWLGLIRAHLIENLVIEKEDFKGIPFSRHGGWSKADEDFEHQLEKLLEEINMEMVA